MGAPPAPVDLVENGLRRDHPPSAPTDITHSGTNPFRVSGSISTTFRWHQSVPERPGTRETEARLQRGCRSKCLGTGFGSVTSKETDGLERKARQRAWRTWQRPRVPAHPPTRRHGCCSGAGGVRVPSVSVLDALSQGGDRPSRGRVLCLITRV